MIATIVVTSWVAAQRPIRVGVDLVHFGIVVTDRQGAPITGLTIDDFEVLERGKPQAVKFFAPADAAAAPVLHLGFLLDVSGSMAEDIKDVRTAAIKFLNQNERAVDVTLVDFDTEVRVARFTDDDSKGGTGATVTSVSDPAVRPLGASTGSPASPRRLLVTTIGDGLKIAAGQARSARRVSACHWGVLEGSGRHSGGRPWR
jgi:hypothetical protein